MARLEYNYKFLLDGVQIPIIVGDEFGYKYEKEQDAYYFRKKLNNEIKITGSNYRTIRDSNIETKFTFEIQRYESSWTTDYVGTFYKTDCKFDDDTEVLTVNPAADDGWEDIKEVINNEYNLIDLLPNAYTVNYKLRPVLQIMVFPVLPGVLKFSSKYILNIVGLSYWTEELSKEYSELNTDFVTEFKFEKLTTSKANYYVRYLTDKDTFNSITTDDRPDDDISGVSSTYDKISREIITGSIQESTSIQDLPTKWGKTIILFCSQFVDKYYVEFSNPNFYSIPIIPENFLCDLSYWYLYNDSVTQYELDNSTDVQLKDSYKLSEVIQLLLSQLTNIKHQDTIAYSEFFYSGTDPVAGQAFELLITPKSNVANSFYNQPARKANIRLSEVFEMLANVFNVYWHIEDTGTEKILRLEHINWYENGGKYGGQSITYDTTINNDNRTQLALSSFQNKYEYRKDKMPQRLEFSWSDEVGDQFKGLPIEIISPQIEKGNIQERRVSSFTTDLNFVLSNQNVNLNKFFLFSAEINGSEYDVINYPIELKPNVTSDEQNGLLSFKNLHNLYHGYSMPAANIKINGQTTTAKSIKRTKQQELRFTASNLSLNLLQLIKTGLGSGQIEELEHIITNNTYVATLNHDTE